MPCLVQDAIAANLPLVVVTSTDPFYDTAIIKHMTSKASRVSPSNSVTLDEHSLVKLLVGDGKTNPYGNKVVSFVGDCKKVAWKDIYESCLEKRSTVVIILRNGEDFNLGYHAGALTPPEDMVFESLKAHCQEINIPNVQKSLRGLSLSDLDAVLRLTKQRDSEITPAGIRETRKEFVGGVRGLKVVDVHQPYYKPDAVISEWLKTNRLPFQKAEIAQLIPRGLVLEGVAGTGKSAGAKYIAQHLNVSLVKIDMGSMLSKWSGEAELNLELALDTLDQMAPCVALFDEIEKVVSSNDDDGSGRRLLAKLLWWLQERKSRVLVVMTTNRLDQLPQELFRPPRTDETITLNGMPATEANVNNFLTGLCEPFKEAKLKLPLFQSVWQALQKERYFVVDNKKQRKPDGELLAQAEITGEYIKQLKTLNYS